jgi:hypothetical protein
MRDVRPGRSSLRLLGLLLLVAVVGLLLQGSSVPHTHAPATPGFYNQDHDLVLLATLHGVAVPADATPTPVVFLLVAAIALLAIRPPASAPRPTCDCRAPPRA